MSNIAVTHAPSGLITTSVVSSRRVTPNMVRVTFGGGDLDRFEFRGFDQWFRLAIPVDESSRLDRMPDRFGFTGYLKYLSMPKGSRPVVRNYTVRAFRPEALELDVDFVAHGDDGVAGPWAAAAQPRDQVAFIDQGCGWAPVAADWSLLVADESGLPAVAGILRDLPRDARGIALIELFDLADRQELEAPAGIKVRWLERPHGSAPGAAALPALEALTLPAGTPYAFAVGESAVATGARRHLVQTRGIPKQNVTFCGYWKRQPAR